MSAAVWGVIWDWAHIGLLGFGYWQCYKIGLYCGRAEGILKVTPVAFQDGLARGIIDFMDGDHAGREGMKVWATKREEDLRAGRLRLAFSEPVFPWPWRWRRLLKNGRRWRR